MNDASPDPEEFAPVMDTSKASVARAYDYALGGKDNFAVDREFAEAIMASDPNIRISAKLNKEFGRRVVTFMARQGISQFLDMGSGIPTSPPSVHDTARRVIADASVVYVDHDPVVVAHNRALRAIGPGLAVILESFHEPEAIFAHEELTSTIDLSRPVGVLFLSVFQNTPDEKVAEIMADLKRRVAPGSYVAICHISDQSDQAVKDTTAEQVAAGKYPMTWYRTDEQIARFLEGTELVPPGIVDHRDWRPSVEEEDNRPDLTMLFTCGVGRYPG